MINRSSEFVRNGGTPFYLAFETRARNAASAARALADAARNLDGVRAVAPPRRLGANTWQIDLVSTDTPYSATTQRLVRDLTALGGPNRLYVGGDAAAFRDERSAIASHLPIAIAILAAATLVILFLLTGSLAAPLLALAMTALTLAATFGVLILIFQDGRLESLLGYTSQGALDLTIPLVLAALVFAISTDYGVFLLSRIREARLARSERPGGDQQQRRHRRPHRHRRGNPLRGLDRRVRHLEHRHPQDPRHRHRSRRARRRRARSLPPSSRQPTIARSTGMVAAGRAQAAPPTRHPRRRQRPSTRL